MSIPALATLSVQQFLTKTGMTPVPYPPYSPNRTLETFFVSLGEKSPHGKCFANMEEA